MVRTEFPFTVETLDPLWITLADGTRIAATLWRPRTEVNIRKPSGHSDHSGH